MGGALKIVCVAWLLGSGLCAQCARALPCPVYRRFPPRTCDFGPGPPAMPLRHDVSVVLRLFGYGFVGSVFVSSHGEGRAARMYTKCAVLLCWRVGCVRRCFLTHV